MVGWCFGACVCKAGARPQNCGRVRSYVAVRERHMRLPLGRVSICRDVFKNGLTRLLVNDL
jgi:hypothetical protein